ncbi:MAG: hypothetical protein LZF62_300038 [Nitrospira sp.]|nr:MAG: hypothetical protein LZF62_300038 [Nitrospira sp.]
MTGARLALPSVRAQALFDLKENSVFEDPDGCQAQGRHALCGVRSPTSTRWTIAHHSKSQIPRVLRGY